MRKHLGEAICIESGRAIRPRADRVEPRPKPLGVDRGSRQRGIDIARASGIRRQPERPVAHDFRQPFGMTRNRIKQADQKRRTPDRDDREIARRQQMRQRGEPPFIDIRQACNRGRNGQHLHEGRHKIGTEVGAFGIHADRNTADAARGSGDRADGHIGPAGERGRTAVCEVGEPRKNGRTKGAQARRRVGNELSTGRAAAGFLECDNGLAREHGGFAARDAVEPWPEVLVRAYRHARAELFDRADGFEAVCAAEFAACVRAEDLPQ